MKNKLVRQQLDETLKQFTTLLNIHRPSKGWIRALRDALGMSARQLGDRIGVSQQRITAIEREELNDTLTLNTLKRIAQSTSTTFVYGFIPKKSLEEIVKRQAISSISRETNRVTHSMRLEGQAPSDKNLNQLIELEADDLINNHPSKVWDSD